MYSSTTQEKCAQVSFVYGNFYNSFISLSLLFLQSSSSSLFVVDDVYVCKRSFKIHRNNIILPILQICIDINSMCPKVLVFIIKIFMAFMLCIKEFFFFFLVWFGFIFYFFIMFDFSLIKERAESKREAKNMYRDVNV